MVLEWGFNHNLTWFWWLPYQTKFNIFQGNENPFEVSKWLICMSKEKQVSKAHRPQATIVYIKINEILINALSNYFSALIIHYDPFLSLLILVDPCWSLLILVDPCWYLLILVDPCWSLLVVVDSYWSLAILGDP